MPSMLLSSVRRCRLYCTGDADDILESGDAVNRQLLNWLQTLSGQIEDYLNRQIYIESRTQYFDVKYQRGEYRVDAFPATTLTSVFYDPSGLWDGNQGEIDDCFIGVDGRAIVLPYRLSFEARKALRVIYTGGLAYHAVNSIFEVTPSGGTPAANKWMIGASSGATGVVVSYSGGALTLEVYFGKFEADETITEYNEEAGTNATGVTATIDTITRRALVESEPALVHATEAQVRYMWRHALDLENAGTTRDGATIRVQLERMTSLPMLKAVRDMLQPYRRYAI